MGSIVLRDVGVTAGRTLFQDLSFTLADGDRLGLVAGIPRVKPGDRHQVLCA